jgi:CheY-like chemotaxis protein
MSTILVIDDNDNYRADMREILTFENYSMLEAENGMVGLQMIRQHSPDVILCDVDMPVMNGIEVLKAVKADSTLAKIPFIVATGHNDELTAKTAHDLGAEKYLTKPMSIAGLLAIIVCFTQENPSVSLQ